MKFRHFMALLIFLSLTTGAIAQTKPAVKMIGATPKSGVHMTFENEHIDIGKVKRGEIKKFDFVFTNTGTEIIEIDIASGCDCTTLDYPKNKILPGKKGTIHVIFDSAKKEESETIDVDIYLKNLNPKTGQRILKIIDYKYELTK
ncbi:MAG: DUF1573 domain-containing protein [Saprospiraceae bacterium]|jgi:hypothetical protein|nr:DUF1573 domain-containing protein [Saprospiraceae bacterium]MBP6567963.1 DUF1573 domain-containing protein [Saprospiraceae bacterium]